MEICFELRFISHYRTAKVAIPATSAGQKVPVVFHLHGSDLQFVFQL